MAEQEPGLDPLDEDARIRSLDQRLRRARTDEAIRSGEGRDVGQDDYNLGGRVLSYLLGGMIGGAVVGWTLDYFLGTSPWLLLALLFLGTAGGFRNIIKLSSGRPK